MHSLSRFLTLLLALATLGRFDAVAVSGDEMVIAAAPAHSHGQDSGDGQHCHHPSHQVPMPCDTGAPGCPLMAGCFTMGPAAIILPAESPSPDPVIAYLSPQTGHGQYAPVPESPPPRA